MTKAIQIESEIQLLVEGNDQRNFFEAFKDHLSLTNIQVQNFGGVDELRDFLLALVDAPGFREIVRSVGIVRDAETSAEGAFQSVQSSLRRAKLPVPDNPEEGVGAGPMVTVLILPGDNRQGMLETLLCESFADTSVEHCIDDFFRCVEALPDVSIGRPDKARAHAYLTTKPQPHLSVGVAAKNGYWNLAHSVFINVRDFLKALQAIQDGTARKATGYCASGDVDVPPTASAVACPSTTLRQAQDKAQGTGSASATPPPGGSNEGGGTCAYLPAARSLAQAGLAGMDDSIADLFSDQWKPTIKEL